MDKITVSSHFVKAALKGAELQGIPMEPILRSVGIPADVVVNPKARVTGLQYTAFIQKMWAVLEDELMGFANTKQKPGTFATACYLIIHCTSLESVFHKASAFYSLFDKPITMDLRIEGEQAKLIVTPEAVLNDPYHFLQESLLVIWHRLACWLTGQRIILDATHFNYSEPPHASEYRHLFNSPLLFDQPDTRMIFNRRFLSLPIIQDELALKEFLKCSPADLLAKPDDSTTYTARIRALIGKDLSQALPDFEFVSTNLNVSPQTLRRRLKDENTSYQEIKDNMRRDVALYHLARQEISINEIAFKVGFTEPSTFHRAFKKWTGLTPGEYREAKTSA